MPWRDVHSDAPGGPWLGLEYSVPRAALACRTALRMEVAPPYLMRLVAEGAPVLWARVTPDQHGYWYLRRTRSQPSPLVLAPISAAVARTVPGEPGSAPWYAAWSRRILRELEASPRTPLDHGRWWMVPCPGALWDDVGWRHLDRRWPGVPPAPALDGIPAQPAHGYSEWDFTGDDLPPLALRSASEETDGRVKAWRRAVREGCLPPVLLLWISGLCRYVLIDGHDRLQAAVLEGQVPPLLALLPVAESRPPDDPRRRAAITAEVERMLTAGAARAGQSTPITVELANRLLVEAYDDRPALSLVSRAWPLEGGRGTWLDELRAEVRDAQEGVVDPEMLGDAR